jgi:succinyl-CoA synthetase beta subunit
LAILLDRTAQGPVIISSPQGGMDIEKVAAENPNAIFKEIIDINKGVTPEQTKKVAANLGFPDSLLPKVHT